jgi:hypothetical protein
MGNLHRSILVGNSFVSQLSPFGRRVQPGWLDNN